MMEMTKSFVAGLLAAAAGLVPGAALAQEGDLGDAMRARMQARVEGQGREGRSPDRPQRAADDGAWQRPERPRSVERGEWHRADRPDQQPATRGDADRGGPERDRGPGQPNGDRGGRPDWNRGETDRGPGNRPGADRPGAVGRPDRAPPGAGRGEWRGRDDARSRDRDRRWTGRDWASARYQRGRDEREWYDRSDFDDRRDWNWRSDDARGGARGWAQGNGRGWDRGWRQSDRYDWSGYRASNRSAYRLPRYYAPYGWSGGYRRFSLGARLAPSLFARSYWIEDPYAYRLPEAYEPYSWVRYYNDALLIDVETGEVVDAINDIFW